MGVIIPPKMSITPVVVRISMGAIFHIPFYSYSLFPAIKEFKNEGFLIAGIEINGEKTIYDTNLSDNVLLIVGGEDKSISPEVAQKCDVVMNIPQYGHVNSLNMSVAAGLAIFEYARQNHK
jgi:23S rRNA (guanosine2251-2'-O)-methyltransferase